MSKPMKLCMTISVLLNLLLGGMLLGQAWQCIAGMGVHHPAQEIAAALPADKRATFESAMQKMEQDTASLHDQYMEARKKAGDLLKAEPFDRKAYLEQAQRVQELRAQMTQHLVQTVADLGEKLDARERGLLTGLFRHSSDHDHEGRPAPHEGQ